MDFQLDWKKNKTGVLKMIGIVVLGLVLLTFGFNLVQSPMRLSSGNFLGGIGMSESSVAPGFYDKDMMAEDGAALSYRNVATSMPPFQPGVPGADAEAFEVTQYSATIETRDLEGTCSTIAGLKVRDYIIFENSNQYDHGCSYTFKVTRANVLEIVALLETLDPKDLSENIYTIKRQIDDFTSEVEILTKKKESIEATLNDAINAYDQLTKLATDTRDVETLAKIIDSKIRTIEQLTQQRISVNEQLDRLSRAKAESLDRLDYTYFYVNIYENKFVDGEVIKDSWKAAVKESVMEINEVIQSISIGLLALLLLAGQYILYGILLLVLGKWAWKFAKQYWNK